MAKADCHRRVQENTCHHHLSLSPQSIGVFDSGVGGLSVLKALRTELPLENFIYIADSAHAPYGERDDAYVIARSRAIAVHLVSQNIKALVIACNTATAAAIHLLRAEYPLLPIIGVEPALKPAVELSKTGNIAVMATRSTLASAKFQALLDTQRGLANFVVQACDGLADAIERGVESQDATEIIADCARFTRATGIFGPQTEEIDTLILGCTHYPFARPYLQELLGPHVQIVDNGEAVARQTRRLLVTREGNACDTSAQVAGQVKLLTTGQPHALKAAAASWLGLNIPVRSLYLS